MVDFIRSDSEDRKKIIRTTLYEDQEFSLWELEILHTSVLQRLYDLKQLGFADRVFPDAVHSRFNHILGVAEVVERMAGKLAKWLCKNSQVRFTYAADRHSPTEEKSTIQITGSELADLLQDRIPSLRLMALLHDIAHAAFGHTLEDEVRVFEEKHDDPPRQLRFFNGLVGQMFYTWCVEARIQVPDNTTINRLNQLSCTTEEFRDWVEEFADSLTQDERLMLAKRLRHLEIALRLLLRIEFVHHSEARILPAPEPLFV